MNVAGPWFKVGTMEKNGLRDLSGTIRLDSVVQLVMVAGTQPTGKLIFSFRAQICFSHGEVWLGLDYWFWVQRSFGKSGAKLCNYIASGDTQRTYEYICYEKFLISGAKDNFRLARIGMSSRKT